MKKIGVLFVTVIIFMLFALSVNALDSIEQYGDNAVLSVGETVNSDNHKHEYAKYISAPTCTKQGYTAYICEECGDAYRDDYVDMLPHEYEAQVTKEPTHYEEGSQTLTCKCGDTYTEALPKTPHTYRTVVKAPTCLEPSYTTYICEECNYSYTDNYKEPMAHSYVITHVFVEHSCEKDSYAMYTCQCGDSYMDVYIPSTGHDYDGQTCIKCGKVCICNCHKTGFMGFVWKIELFFNKLFKTNKECSCGADHY